MTDSPQAPGAQPAQERDGRPSRLLASAICALEALAVLGWAGLEVVRAGTGRASTPGVAAALGGLLVAFALALAVMALGWRRGASWPKTPTIVWNLLLLPVAWSLGQAGNLPLGVAVGVVALAGIAAAAATPTTFELDPQD